MRKVGRREFLLGLGAGTGMAALGPRGWGKLLASKSVAPGSRTLNVLIHGMFVVDVGQAGQGITLYAPIAPDNSHVYQAGNWKHERAIHRGAVLSLTGVTPGGRPTLDNLHYHENPVFPRHAVNPRLAYFTFQLPFPDDYGFLRLAHKQSGQPFFLGSPAPYDHPDAIPEVVAFIYHNASATPAIHTLPWTPKFHNGFANLHIWAMRPRLTTEQHIQDTFSVMAKMMGDSKITPNKVYLSLPIPPVDAHTGVPGVPSVEEETLHERPVPNAQNAHNKTRPPYSCSSLFMY